MAARPSPSAPLPLLGWGNSALLASAFYLLPCWLWLQHAKPRPAAERPPAAVMQVWAAQAQAPAAPQPLPNGVSQQLATAPAQSRPRPRNPLPKLAEAGQGQLQKASDAKSSERDAPREADAPSESSRAATSQSAAPQASLPGETAAAPLNSEGAAGKLQASWQGLVQSHLARFRRYPDDARRRSRAGEVWVQFTLDGEGRLLASRMLSGSGTVSLDREALAMLRRADPLPPPPAAMQRQGRVSVSLPIHFDLNRL